MLDHASSRPARFPQSACAVPCLAQSGSSSSCGDPDGVEKLLICGPLDPAVVHDAARLLPPAPTRYRGRLDDDWEELPLSEAPTEDGSSCSEDYDYFTHDGRIDGSICSDRELLDAEGLEEHFDTQLATDSGEGMTAHRGSFELVTRICRLSPLAITPAARTSADTSSSLM